MPNNPKHKRKKKSRPNEEELYQTCIENLASIKRNPRKLNTASYALQKIVTLQGREINMIFTDKPFLKDYLSRASEIDGIYSRLMLRMGDEELPENLKAFQEKMTNITKATKDLIEFFYTKNIGYPSEVEKFKKRDKDSEKTETDSKETETKK